MSKSKLKEEDSTESEDARTSSQGDNSAGSNANDAPVLSNATSSRRAASTGRFSSLSCGHFSLAAFAFTDNFVVLGYKVQIVWLLSGAGIIGTLAYSHGLWLYPSTFRLYQPFKGGLRFVVLQFMSWLTYALSIVLLAAGLWHAERNRGILTSAGS